VSEAAQVSWRACSIALANALTVNGFGKMTPAPQRGPRGKSPALSVRDDDRRDRGDCRRGGSHEIEAVAIGQAHIRNQQVGRHAERITAGDVRSDRRNVIALAAQQTRERVSEVRFILYDEHSWASAHAVYGNGGATSNSSNETEFADARGLAYVARLTRWGSAAPWLHPSTLPMYAIRLPCGPVLLMHRMSAMRNNGAREVWWHDPTGDRWIVDTDSGGMVMAVAGPFAGDDWHQFLRGHVSLNRDSADYVREHRGDFVRLTAEIVVT
jgi:hypothetical protein